MKASILTSKQVKIYGPKPIAGYGEGALIRAKVRYDDQCGNGHNTFSITADVYIPGRRDIEAGGCLHEEIAKAFPELAPLIKWHLTSSDGPMHYVANTVYHATQHGPTSAHVYHEDKVNGIERRCVKYCDIEEAQHICKTAGYSMEVDQKTAEEANLEYARSSAIWPDATQEQLLDKAALLARLPALMEEFQTAMESLGFIY